MSIDLSIIIVNWNTRQLLLQTIASVYENPPGPYSFEIIVIDNNSSDGSQAALRQAYPQVQLIENSDNRGFGPANNQGLKIAQGRYSLMLNSDTIVQPGSLQQVLEFMEARLQVGMCGIRLLNPDGSFQASFTDFLNLRREFLILTGLGRRFINRHYPNHSEAESLHNRPADVVQGAFMFARTEALQQVGWLDEQFFMYGEENDLSMRLYQAGWQTYYLGKITIIHLGGQSTNLNMTKMAWQLQKSKVLLFRKHYGWLASLNLKLMVSLAVLTKLLVFNLKQNFKPSAKTQLPSNNKWLNWSDFRQFIQAS